MVSDNRFLTIWYEIVLEMTKNLEKISPENL